MAQSYDVSYRLNATGNFEQVNKQAISINKNMKEAAAAAGAMPKAASAALATSGKGTRGALAAENREYGAARGSMGATGASGRDFAKQAEGLGGLVRLYATFAANIFAASMAFEAFKRSFAFEQLQKASDAFAITTGKNLAGVAADLKKLADGALTDKAAQQMANYGSSAGFTSEQLRRTIGVARGASQALGRDMGDAVDRLMRGMGKLEPELLDELGLLTRTKAAGQEYAKSVGKTFETLTQFEKTQAFVNAVLKEGEEKFGAVSRAVQVSPFEKFTTALINAGTVAANFVNKGLVPILEFFSNNPTAMIVALGAAFLKLLTTALPALTRMGDAAKAAASEQTKALKLMQTRALDASKSIEAGNREHIRNLRLDGISRLEDVRKTLREEVKYREEFIKGINSKSKTLQDIKAGVAVDPKTLANAIRASDALAASGATGAKAAQRTAVELREYERINNKILALEKEKTEEFKNQAALRARAHSTQLAENVALGQAFRLQKARVEMGKVSADQIANVVSTAQVYGMRKAFTQLGEAVTTVSNKHKELYKDINAVSATGSRYWAVTTTAAKGFFGILTTGVSNFLSVAGPWMAVIGLIIAGFTALVELTDGINKNLEELKDKQDAFAGVLKVSGDQALKFTELQKAVDGTAESFLKIKSYSANVFTGIADGIASTSAAFSKFVLDSDGWWSKISEGVKSMWDGDAVTKQVKQLRSSIYTILSTTSADDVSKVQDAILRAMPSAKSVEDVLDKIGSLTNSQLADFGNKLSTSLSQVNIQLKASEDNLKNAIGGWKSLGEAIDKYNDKNEVKDPKLKGVVDALQVINSAYRSATTEKERALVISKVDKELQDKLVKLMEERGLATKELVTWLEKARKSSADYAAQEVAAAEAREKSQRDSALNYTNVLQLMQAQSNAFKTYEKLQTTEYKPNDMRLGADRAEFLSNVHEMQSLIEEGLKEAKKAGDGPAIRFLEGWKLGLKNLQEDFHKGIQPAAEELGNNIKDAILKGVSGGTLSILDQFHKGVKTIRSDTGDTGIPQEFLPRPPEKVIATPAEIAAKQLAALNAIRDKHEKISKQYEYAVQLAAAQEAQVRRIADAEKELVGYVDEITAAKIKDAMIERAGAEYVKRAMEIEKEFAEQTAKGNKDATKNRNIELGIARDILQTTAASAELERLKAVALQEVVRYEKLVLEPLKLQLSINDQILDIRKSINAISDLEFNKAKITNKAVQDRAELYKKQLNIQEKINRHGSREDAKGEEAKKVWDRINQVLSVEQEIAKIEAKRIDLTEQINKQVEEYKSKIEDAARIEEIITNSLQLQSDSYSVISSQAERDGQLQQATQAAITVQAAKYLEITRNLTDEKDKQIVFNNSILELENKILEMRRAQFEANARDPRADILKTITEGMDLAYRDAVKKAVGLAKSIVDGVAGGISAAVDQLAEAAIAGGKVSFKDLARTFGNELKKSVLQGFASQLKAQLLSFFKIQGAESEAMQLKKKLEEEIAAQKDTVNKINDNIKALDSLTTAINSLRQAILSQPKAPSEASQREAPFNDQAGQRYVESIISTTEATEDLGNYFDDWGTSIDDTSAATEVLGSTTEQTTNALEWFGSTLVGVGKGLGSLVMTLIGSGGGAGGGSGIIGLLSKGWDLLKGSDFGKGIGDWFSGAFGHNYASGEVGAANGSWDLVGNAGGQGAAGGGVSGMLSGAGTGYAIGNFAHSLVGNERNQQGMSIGGAVGGAIGQAVIPIPVVGTLIGSAVGTAIGSLVKSGGGPKTEGYAATGNVGDNKRWMTAGQRDSELKKVTDTIEAGYKATLKAVGGKAKGDVGFAIGGSTDPKGTAPNNVHSGVWMNGQQIYDNPKEGGRGEEEFAKTIALESKRAVLAALTASELPENVANYFKSVTTEAIKQMSEEEVDAKLDFGTVLGTIHKSRALIANVFGEDLYNLTEGQLKDFQRGTEKLSETFNRLYSTFVASDRLIKLFKIDIKTAFGDIGLAGASAREALVDAAGGIEEFGSQLTYFIENFYTAAEQAEIAFSSSVLNMQLSFQSLGVEIPKSMAAYKDAVKASIVAGNTELTASLLKLAPAFNSVIGALEMVVMKTDETIASLLNEIDDMMLDEVGKYEKYAARAETDSAKLDAYMAMSTEELTKAIADGLINPQMLQLLSSSVTDNVKTAIGNVASEDRAAMAPEWMNFLAEFGENVGTFTERVNAIIATTSTGEIENGTDKKAPEADSSNLSSFDNIGMAVGLIDSSFLTGAEIVGNSITSALSSFKFGDIYGDGGMNEAIVGGGDTTGVMGKVLEDAAKNSANTQQVIFDQQAATLASLADKLLGAAGSIEAAAAGQLAAAATPKDVRVMVTVNSPVPTEVETSEVNG